MSLSALQKAINECRGQTRLARSINKITAKNRVLIQSNISRWLIMGRVPSDWVLDVEAVSGVPCWELRPDLYPPERFFLAAKS